MNIVDGNECTSLQRLSDTTESCGVKDSVFAKNVRYILENACTLCKKLLYRSQCVTCSESIEVNSDITFDEESVLCRSRMNCIKKDRVPKKAKYANNLDSGIIPDCLKGLWVVEKRLISLVQLFLTLFVLPGGQTAQKELAIHFPVDLHLQTQNRFENVIDFENVVTLCCERPNSVSVEVLARPKMIIKALKLLQENNNLYINVNLSNLDQLNCQNVCDAPGIEVEESGTIFKIFTVSSNPSQCTVPSVKSKPVNIKTLNMVKKKHFHGFILMVRMDLHFQSSKLLLMYSTISQDYIMWIQDGEWIYLF